MAAKHAQKCSRLLLKLSIYYDTALVHFAAELQLGRPDMHCVGSACLETPGTRPAAP